MNDLLERAKTCRNHATALRAVAEDQHDPDILATLHGLASDYENTADGLEALAMSTWPDMLGE
jgi:hypothetical protein